MVRKYQKKTDRLDISEEAIVQALNDYRNGNYRSIREAAEAHGLKKSTLHFRLSKINKKENEGHKPEDIDLEKEHEDLPQPVKSITVEDMAPVYNSKYSHRQVFTPEQEAMIVDYCIERSKIFQIDSSDTDEDVPKYDDGGDSPFSEEEDDFEAPLNDQSFNVNDFILTKFPTKKTVYHFIGQIEEENEDGFSVKFLKKRENSLKFFFSDSPEVSIVDPTDILFKMRQPDITGGTSRAANCFVFKEDLSLYNFK
ncbi:uncharacterized protein LOC120353805 isoform X2 [Nilaparvata lugens]|nr:uncharacterized protein LOC120353805 isoform X2 [Nilaparvata lugens]